MAMKFFVAMVFFAATGNSMAHPDPRIDSLIKLGGEALIEMAVKEINDPGFHRENYDRISVLANKNTLLVEFRLSILLKSKSSCFYYVVDVALVGSGTGGNIIGDCDETPYYQNSPADQKKIRFVLDAINASDEVGHIPDYKLPDDTSMEIIENAGHYQVEVSSWSTFSYYKVNKLTGKISEAGHKHYDRSDGDEPEFKTIYQY